MQYVRVDWRHNHPDEPVQLCSEIDDRRMEVRKVEIFRDGTADFADRSSLKSKIRLSEVPLPSLEEIASDSQFVLSKMSKEEFEDIWLKATGRRV